MPASSYHHGNLREALVEAAVQAARTGGPDGVALRELARTVGVSHSAAYRHFSHRDGIVAEVATRAMGELVEAMQQRLDAVERAGAADPAGPVDPVLRARRRLIAIGEGYVAFALAEPGLFRSAFAAAPTTLLPDADADADADADGDGAGHGHGAGDPEAQADPYGLLTEALDELAAVGYLSAAARTGAEMTCWSAVHGFSLLHLDGPLGATDVAARQDALDQVLVAIDRSYAASSGTPIRPDDDIFTRAVDRER